MPTDNTKYIYSAEVLSNKLRSEAKPKHSRSSSNMETAPPAPTLSSSMMSAPSADDSMESQLPSPSSAGSPSGRRKKPALSGSLSRSSSMPSMGSPGGSVGSPSPRHHPRPEVRSGENFKGSRSLTCWRDYTGDIVNTPSRRMLGSMAPIKWKATQLAPAIIRYGSTPLIPK
eukprot:TRINITY_DN15384_c0_g1_i2.p1 TRINITY_DN15384_c0_g1~~TRINITY_DN15384_c0_g1_i2.p1  ORF type:complete len:201 (+),score=15.97 TRINITY_DN15384_c0_g1_i2:88-603(+)